MKPGLTISRGSRGQRGYALLMVMFFVALLVIAVASLAPNVLTQGRREKEEEMIWRGQQYVRGVKLYVRKNAGRFPTSLDDLTEPKTGIRIMRQAYKDPMNTEDGSWRLIYVGPSGQLIGSLKPHPQNLNLAGAGVPQLGTPAAALSGTTAVKPAQSDAAPTPTGLQGNNPTTAPGEGEGAPETDNSNAMATPQGFAPTEAPTIMGGNIIGVGSKINKKSIIWYEQARNYRQFEFIWDPAKEAAGAAVQPPPQAIGSPGTPAPAVPPK